MAEGGRRYELPRWVARVVRQVALAVVVGTVIGLAVDSGTVGTILVLAGILASVALHEAAHLAAARSLGVKASEYFVGFGPTLWSRRSGELRWGVKLLPLGGYVKLVGMDSAEEVDPADESRSFRAQRPGVRAAVAAAGPLANIALAALLFMGLGIASHDGLEAGLRDGQTKTVEVLEISTQAIVDLPAVGVDLLGGVVSGDEVADEHRVLSPVGATRLADQAVAAGPELAIGLIAVVNIFLGLLNLLPLLPFDGGHVAVAAYERVASTATGRHVRVDAHRLKPVAFAVVAALLALGAAALVLDLTQPVADPF